MCAFPMFPLKLLLFLFSEGSSSGVETLLQGFAPSVRIGYMLGNTVGAPVHPVQMCLGLVLQRDVFYPGPFQFLLIKP